MVWQHTPYTIPLLAAAAVCIVSAVYVWRHPSSSASRIGVVLMLAGAMWTAAHALKLASANLSAKIMWDKLRFLGTGVVPTAWLIYVKEYTAADRWLTRRRLLLLGIVPLATLLLTMTNEQHGLICAYARLETGGRFTMMVSSRGPALWAYLVYSYVVVGTGVFVLVQALLRSGHLLRWQASAILFTVLTPWLASIVMDTLGWKPFPDLEATPIALALTLPAIAWGLRRLRIRDIVPVARDSIIENMTDGVMVLDEQDRVVDLNRTVQQLIGHDRPTIMARAVGEVWPEWSRQISSYRDGSPPVSEMLFDSARGRRTYDVRVSSVKDWRNRLVSRVVVLRDITERKQAEEEMLQLKAFNEGILQSAAEGVAVVDLGGYLVFVNPAMANLLGYAPEALVREHWTTIVPHDQQSIVRAADERRAKGLSDTYELMLTRKDGARADVLVSGSPHLVDGRFCGTVAAFTDITERKQAEELIKTSLREKELLLQEIHHRVKNNLQIISGLLRMQSRQCPDNNALEVLRDSENRVRSMALVHQALYQSRDLARVDFSGYVRSLVGYLMTSYRVGSRDIAIKTTVDDLSLSIDTAIPCGLILNELVSNALKHAYPDGRGGEIRVECRLENGGQCKLVVSDDGVGFPEALDFRDTTSLGLQLVNGLVGQLDGTVELLRRTGTEFLITLPSVGGRRIGDGPSEHTDC